MAAAETLFQESSAKFERALPDMRPLLVTERGRQLLSDMESRWGAWQPVYAELQRLARAADPDGAARVLSERATVQYLAIGKDAAELAQIVDGLMQNDSRAAADSISSSRWLVLLLIGCGSLAAGFAFWMMRSTTRELRRVAAEMLDGSRQVAAAAGSVAAASQALAQGTAEQAATLEETSSSANRSW